MPERSFKKSHPTAGLTDLPALGMDIPHLVDDFRHYYTNHLGRDRYCRSLHYAFEALALTLRDRLMERWKHTRYAYEDCDCKQAYYLSLEFLMGRALGNALLNLDLGESVTLALHGLGLAVEELADCRARRRARQRRPGAARRLFPRQLRHLATAGDRLRHPLRVWHVPPGDCRRPPGRGAGSLAAQRLSLGDREARVHPAHPLRRPQ